MEENKIYEEQNMEIVNKEQPVEVIGQEKKPIDTASLVLGILSLVVPLVGIVCGIIGLVLAIKRRNEKNTKAALICSIIGIVASIVSIIFFAVTGAAVTQYISANPDAFVQ